MGYHGNFPLPRGLDAPIPDGVRLQYAGLCYRIANDKVQVLLVTSRGTQRWIPPKGWPEPTLKPHETALLEAYEEAGVVGKAQKKPIGTYGYNKLLDNGKSVPCLGVVYPIKVKNLETRFPEAGQRRRKWFSRKKAAKRVDEKELARILKNFDPRKLR